MSGRSWLIMTIIFSVLTILSLVLLIALLPTLDEGFDIGMGFAALLLVATCGIWFYSLIQFLKYRSN